MFRSGCSRCWAALAFVPETQRDPGRRLDWFGFLTLALGVGALQMMLDRGQRLDWFESGEIIVLTCLGVLGLYLFAVHSVTTRDPFLDPRLITQPQVLPEPAADLLLRVHHHAGRWC